MNLCPIRIAVLCFALVTARSVEGTPRYDPLEVSERFEPNSVDEKRECAIPLRVYLPEEKSPAPVVLFSHGLGGSREGNAFMGNHWAGRGYAVVFLQHSGSDTSGWMDVPRGERRRAMQKAAGPKTFFFAWRMSRRHSSGLSAGTGK